MAEYSKKTHTQEYKNREPNLKNSKQNKPKNDADKFSEVLSGGKPRGAAGALIELDKEIMKLLVRRATLVSRIRGGREHAATPQAILEEKSVRKAFEENALAFSKDPKFTRELFTLLQDIKVLSKEQAEAKASFVLAPRKAPLDASITGSTCGLTAQALAALAACTGQPITLANLPMTTETGEFANALQSLGAEIYSESTGTGLGRLVLKPSKPINFIKKTVFAGNSHFALYLFCFLAATNTGVTRLTGGAELKNADLSALRNTLPSLGARLANTMPRSTGLPASLECSGALPETLLLNESMPSDMVAALLVSLLLWTKPVEVDTKNLPSATVEQALSLALPVFKAVQVPLELTDSLLKLVPAKRLLPENPTLPMNPVSCAYFLAMPAFIGGKITIKGFWEQDLFHGKEIVQLLQDTGLTVTTSKEGISVENRGLIFQKTLQRPVHKELAPLFEALLFKKQALEKKPVLIECESDWHLVSEIATRLGLCFEDGLLGPCSGDVKEKSTLPWTAPNAPWGMAFALVSFVGSGIALANPHIVSDKNPVFWPVFNSLPNPIDPFFPPRTSKEKIEDEQDDKPVKRRIIAE